MKPKNPWRRKPIWKRWRWDLAYLIDNHDRRKRWCWASLASWAANDGQVRELPESRDVSICDMQSRDTQRCGACYCGKFRKDSE